MKIIINNDKMVFDYSKTLSIAQCPMAESDIKKTPKKRGRKPKSSKTRDEMTLVYNQLSRILLLHTKEA